MPPSLIRPGARARRALPILILLSATLGTASATDLHYTLQSPSFGGTDAEAYTYAQYTASQKQAQENAIAAAKQQAANAASSAAASSPSQQFANSIISQLESLVARNVALQIAAATPGQAGTISSDGSTITYVNSDGQLNVSITTATGTTTFSVPSVN